MENFDRKLETIRKENLIESLEPRDTKTEMKN